MQRTTCCKELAFLWVFYGFTVICCSVCVCVCVCVCGKRQKGTASGGLQWATLDRLLTGTRIPGRVRRSQGPGPGGGAGPRSLHAVDSYLPSLILTVPTSIMIMGPSGLLVNIFLVNCLHIS